MSATQIKQTESQSRLLEDLEKTSNVQGLSKKEVSALLNLNEHITFKGLKHYSSLFSFSITCIIYFKIKRKGRSNN